MRVLEVGSGGYHAALMVELVGEDGEVTTVDIDPEVINRARECLTDAGYPRVNTVLADGEDGCAQFAPYDRVIVTAGAWNRTRPAERHTSRRVDTSAVANGRCDGGAEAVF